ncbi:MAG: hypothetical protein ACE5LH_01350 [Fidelibacterota bacterium]
MIAISIKSGRMRFARADLDNGMPTLRRIGETALPAPLTKPDLRSDRLNATIGGAFQHVRDFLEGDDRDVYVSLGEEWVETDILEVDGGLSLDQREAYVNWALQQRLGPLWDDSASFLSLVPDGPGERGLVVASVTSVKVIRAVRDAVRNIGGIPVWMEAGVLSLNRVTTSLDDGRTTRTLAMEPADGIFRGLFHERGQLRALAQFTLRAGVARETVMKGDRNLVSECLRAFNAYLASDDLSPDLRVFVSGEISRYAMNVLTHSGTAEGVLTVINPFADLQTGEVSLPDTANGSWYVDVRGLIDKGAF